MMISFISVMMYTMFSRSFFVALLSLAASCGKGSDNSNAPPPPPIDTAGFTNPILSSGPDPWVVQRDCTYYYTHTFGNRIAIYKTEKISELSKAPVTTIWTPPATGPYSKNIWAPELHFIDGKWYTYFAADDGNNENHRLYVLENASADPTNGSWEFKGKISDPTDKWAIDGTVFEHNGQSYFLWSGWEGDVNVQQNIYIAKMANPWTLDGNRVLISAPVYDWEKIGTPDVNEGPEIIKNDDKVFMTYSASGCWTDDYSIGMLSLKQGGNPMNPADWTKSPNPVFVKKPENGAYAPGHNGFFKSRDGKEDWIIYHANTIAAQGCSNTRNPRIQKFTWHTDGTPNFGEPVKINTKINKPSGE